MIDYITALIATRFEDAEEGQTMAEYAVVLAVITVIIVAALTALSGGIGDALDKVTATVKGDG
jgi:Flp pilus assembly pilin Flp